jgi:hypothetical protein
MLRSRISDFESLRNAGERRRIVDAAAFPQKRIL